MHEDIKQTSSVASVAPSLDRGRGFNFPCCRRRILSS